MHIDTLYQNLYQIGRGNSATFSATLQTVYRALEGDDEGYLNVALGRVAAESDALATNAFDGIMDMVCAEPDARGWRCFALTVFIRKPAGLLTVHLDNCTALENMLAQQLDIDPTEIRCDPMLLPTDMLFDQGPREAYRQCKVAKAYFGSVERPVPRTYLCNEWLTSELTLETVEAVILIGVHIAEEDASRVFEAFCQVVDAAPACMAEAWISGHAPVPVELVCAGGNAPWSAFCSALHTKESLEFGAALRAVGARLAAPIASLSLIATYVEEQDAQSNSVRVSFISQDGKLEAGFIAYDLHEPEILLGKINLLLTGLGCKKVHQVEQTYFNVEIDDNDDEPSFFTQGRRWEPTSHLYET